LKISITHPFCWPAVRRGSERFLAELAQYLTSTGHDVVTLSSTPGKKTWEEVPGGGRRYLVHHSFPRWMEMLRLRSTDPFAWKLIAPLLRIDSDVVHCLLNTDTASAIATRPFRHHKVIMQFQGVPYPFTYRRIPPERMLTRWCMRHADAVVVISQFCLEMMREHFGLEAQVLYPPVNVHHFTPFDGRKSGPPTILCVASLKDRRKGVRTLVRAFELIKRDVPDAILKLSGEITPSIEMELAAMLTPAIRQDVHFLGTGELVDLPRLYREATVTCLPSMWEAFGLVVVESWASGTPVVVTRHGSFPELLAGSPHLGTMFDPQTNSFATINAEGLAEALLAGIRLADQPGVSQACRQRSLDYSWEKLGPGFDKLYRDVMRQS
jgi:glycosyltransferase involved in cell wall biosynthesis